MQSAKKSKRGADSVEISPQKEYPADIDELKEQIDILTLENEKINSDIISKTVELENLKLKHATLDRNGKSEIEDLKLKIKKLNNDNTKLSATVKALSDEAEDLRTRALLNEGNSFTIKDLQNRISMMQTENESLLLENEKLKLSLDEK